MFHPTQRNSALYLILTDKEDLITELKNSGFLDANDYNLISLLYANRIKDNEIYTWYLRRSVQQSWKQL